MDGVRIGLAAVQVLGGVSLLPYPAILVASVMGMAAEGPKGFQRLKTALPYALLAAYPVVWILLYLRSWRAVAEGSTEAAFALSAIPLVMSVAGIVWYLRSEAADKKKRRDARQ